MLLETISVAAVISSVAAKLISIAIEKNLATSDISRIMIKAILFTIEIDSLTN